MRNFCNSFLIDSTHSYACMLTHEAENNNNNMAATERCRSLLFNGKATDHSQS